MQKEPSIIRRPIFEIDGEVQVGFDQPALEKRFG